MKDKGQGTGVGRERLHTIVRVWHGIRERQGRKAEKVSKAMDSGWR